MNADWVAYLVTALAVVGLATLFIQKRKKGGDCCKNSCAFLLKKTSGNKSDNKKNQMV